MRIEIKRGERVVLITFDTKSDRFSSNYERNKFFRELYGWKQIVPKEHKRYQYRRDGLLDTIPHMKISNSVFIIAMEHFKQVESFFEQWKRKVEYDMIEVMLENILRHRSKGELIWKMK